MTTALERGCVVSVTSRPHFTLGKHPVPVVQEAGWAPGPVWTGAENLVPTGIRYPDRPTRSSIAIPTELPGPLNMSIICRKAVDKIQVTLGLGFTPFIGHEGP
jgi:hypothetical protein